MLKLLQTKTNSTTLSSPSINKNGSSEPNAPIDQKVGRDTEDQMNLQRQDRDDLIRWGDDGGKHLD